jgi:predicted nucleotidyltransferase
MVANTEIQELYTQALDSLIEKVKRDPYIVAAILLGSLSHDVVWEKSDIDLMLVTEETRSRSGG